MNVHAGECDQWARATTSDQKTMVMLIAFHPHVLGLKAQDLFSAKIENYVSWKGPQKTGNCMADTYHRGDIEVQALTADAQICTTKLTLYRRDNFLSEPGTTDNKIENQSTVCAPQSADQAALIQKCQAVSCGMDMDTQAQMFPDYQDACACKTVERMIQFTNEQDKYEDFFDPSKLFPMPAGIDWPIQ